MWLREQVRLMYRPQKRPLCSLQLLLSTTIFDAWLPNKDLPKAGSKPGSAKCIKLQGFWSYPETSARVAHLRPRQIWPRFGKITHVSSPFISDFWADYLRPQENLFRGPINQLFPMMRLFRCKGQSRPFCLADLLHFIRRPREL